MENMPAALAFYENELLIAFPARFQSSSNLSYSLLVTKAHIPDVRMLPVADRQPFLTSIIEVSAIVESATKASGVTIRMNTGPPGQDVAHLHVHIVPRHLTDGHDGYVLGELPQMTEEQRRTQASRLRQHAAGLRANHSAEGGASSPAEGCRVCAQVTDKRQGMQVLHVGEAAIAPSPFQRRGNEGELIVFPVAHVTHASATSTSCREALVEAITGADRLFRITTGATGTTMRQHDGPPSQPYPHLTYAVTPRFAGDRFLQTAPTAVSPIELRRQFGRLGEVSRRTQLDAEPIARP
jgi:diadenosine tetraphosphate (Ap4A) HIT family hydrolase